MELALRRRFGGWQGLGQSGETDTEGSGMPGGTIDFSSGEVDPSLYYPAPGFNIVPSVDPVTGLPIGPGSTIIPYGQPGGQMTGPVPPVNSAQLAQAIAAGTIVLSKSLTGAGRTCPSGYATPQGQCVQVQGMMGQIIPGVQNQTLMLFGLAFLALMMMGGGRRR